MSNLTDLQRDTLTELLNIGVGRAAASLSEMVGTEIELAVPSLELLSRRTVANLMRANGAGQMVAVQQQFSGVFWGDILLVFPEAQSLQLVRYIMKDDLLLESMTEMEQEALLEIGNIILNACLGSMANILQSEVCSSLPSLRSGSCEDILADTHTMAAAEDVVLFLHMAFALHERSMQGSVMFVVDGNAMAAIQTSVDHFLSHL